MSNIAIVGAGISGLSAAYFLRRQHEVTVFEGQDRIGGHTATIDVQAASGAYAIDTGFIVYNERTYPSFIRLLDDLGVASQPTSMGFSVSDESTGLEYSGDGLGGLFAQKRNILRPAYWQMLRDIVRFNRESVADLEAGRIDTGMTLGQYLDAGRYGDMFRTKYLVPMGAAIWSSGGEGMNEFPVEFFVRFFRNHGLLQLRDRPMWRVIRGGSRSYLEPLTRTFSERIRVGDPVVAVLRDEHGVSLRTRSGASERFDQVVLATHSDEALALLGDATSAEQEVLAALPYSANDVVLHTDEQQLPARRRTWSSWNYRICADSARLPVLTYNINILQGLQSPETFCVTLNSTAAIDPDKILGRFSYSHPVFTRAGIAAQQRWEDVNGPRRTWFCGAYWRNGFHEDGVASALRVAEALGGGW